MSNVKKAHFEGLRAKALESYKSGKRPAQISEEIGVSKKVIERWVRQAGVGRGRSANIRLAFEQRSLVDSTEGVAKMSESFDEVSLSNVV